MHVVFARLQSGTRSHAHAYVRYDRARVQALWKVVYSRAASPDEMADALAHVHAVSQMRGEASFAWQNLAQALLASNEFMHVE